jgi:hypothetical protein
MMLLPLGFGSMHAATIDFSSGQFPGSPSDTSGAAQWLDFQQDLTANPRIKVTDVTETSSGEPALNPDVPLLYPNMPSAASSQTGVSVFFDPTSFVQVDTTSTSANPFDIKSKRSDLSMVFQAQKNSGAFAADIAGYSINRINFQMTGELSMIAPFAGLGSAAYAKVQTGFALTLNKTNFSDENLETPITKPFSLPLQVTRKSTGVVTNVMSEFGEEAFATVGVGAADPSYEWDTGLVSLSEEDLRTLFGITNSTDAITEISLSLVTEVFAAGFYGQGTSRVNSVTVGAGVEAVAVPEPPTIILAGLGAAAAVGHGYRRRKLRQRDAEGSDADWNGEEGAIALTA